MLTNKANIINFIFALIPISYIAGNYFINLNFLIIILFSIFFYQKKIFKLQFNYCDKIIALFFLYILLVLIINYINIHLDNKNFPLVVLEKTFFFFRYFLLYISIRYLFETKILNLNYFFYSCLVCCILISFDIFIQFIFGKNLLGLSPVSDRHYSSFFGQELIAGGYLLKFGIFALFTISIFTKRKIFLTLSIFILLFAILLSGNRMPLILFSTFIVFYAFFLFKLKRYLFAFFFFIFVFFLISFNNIKSFNTNVDTFYKSVNNLISVFLIKNNSNQLNSNELVVLKPYEWEFKCFYKKFKEKPLFGGGIRSYRVEYGCNTHPHNYYFEIAVDLGFFGLFFIFILIFQVLKKIILNKNFLLNRGLYPNPLLPFLSIFFIEFFPLRSSGSFFTTGNAGYLFISLAILISLIYSKYKNSIKFI